MACRILSAEGRVEDSLERDREAADGGGGVCLVIMMIALRDFGVEMEAKLRQMRQKRERDDVTDR